jgi:hypothetical protein
VVSRDGSRAPRQGKMGRKDHRLDLYSPKASPWKEREALREGFDFGNFGQRRMGKEGRGSARAGPAAVRWARPKREAREGNGPLGSEGKQAAGKAGPK